MRVEAYRQPGDRQGPLINDPLLVSLPPAMERARNEIDRNATGREIVVLTCAGLGFIQPGQIVEVSSGSGRSWRGMVTGWTSKQARTENGFEWTTTLTIERER